MAISLASQGRFGPSIMLKHVALSDLELGMYVHKMEGGWFDHPFWKPSFLISNKDRLNVLRKSRLRGVIIDISRGKDLALPSGETSPSESGATASIKRRIEVISKRGRREGYVAKPISIGQELAGAHAIATRAGNQLHRTFMAARLGKALNVSAVEPVVNDIFHSVRRNPHAFSGLMRCKLKNETMFRHAVSVSALMVSLAQKMQLPRHDVHQCGLAGMLLDIGVSYLPQTLEPSSGSFRDADPKIWQQHVVLGYRSLHNDNDLPRAVLDAVLQHHERIDGGGFPHQLEGSEISTFARMATICDTFDFLLCQTGTACGLDPAKAIDQMKTMEGAFDEEILNHFVESVGLYPVGSFVRLQSGKLAMVIDEDAEDHMRPIVQAFYSLAQGEQITPHRIELARSGEQDCILGIAELAGLGLPDDQHLREMIFFSTYKNVG
ncbi:HD-GYP domain-containing protein [Parerythrobacter lacustris]|uniref:DUF3391 domain-containing protein n=1 Tax=Parerythrobacter lacustris TaxID=2969984 RepID=A0ABT1XPW5_9SPHN|nr:HD domain-containing phosphohydrolase [Parerythrobacter lacustris]MCR2833294.1 DUF3391 domain-containing protein [Parerythrobacter lacustris]